MHERLERSTWMWRSCLTCRMWVWCRVVFDNNVSCRFGPNPETVWIFQGAGTKKFKSIFFCAGAKFHLYLMGMVNTCLTRLITIVILTRRKQGWFRLWKTGTDGVPLVGIARQALLKMVEGVLFRSSPHAPPPNVSLAVFTQLNELWNRSDEQWKLSLKHFHHKDGSSCRVGFTLPDAAFA